jgi:integrase
MKAGKEHRVPLSALALTVVEKMRADPEGEFVFPGGNRHKSLSGMAMLALLERMGRSDLTAHGFRSTFRDWAAETTNHPSEVVEMALGGARLSDTSWPRRHHGNRKVRPERRDQCTMGWT